MLRTKAFAACLAWLIAAPIYGASECKLGLIATLPITMNSLRPTLPAKINGRDAQFILDSGAFYSTISSASAAEFNLKLNPSGVRIQGIGGLFDASITTVKEFTLAGVGIKNLQFLVGGSTVGGAGLLGQNILQTFDVEYDLAAGVIRLFRTENCEKKLLAYWMKPDQAYSSMHVDPIDSSNPHTMGRAYINGKEIRIAFDTGAPTSMLSTSAAARAGVTLDSLGVVVSGYSSGVGRGQVKTYIAPFSSFKIGDGEEIKNTRLRMADMDLKFTDMLLGSDFFISHRIFVANKEHHIFMTYNGGPVFNLSKRPEEPVVAGTADQGEPPAAESAATGAAEPIPADAAEIARHGSALAARQEFTPAIAELTKAIELKPDEPEYYFQRSNAYERSGQADLALQDLDRVIALDRDFLPAYIPRAELHFAKKDMQSGLADLDAVDQLAAKPADLRLMLAQLYQRLDYFPAAIAQYMLWIQYHDDDSRMVAALEGRCFSRALQNQDLSAALSDCNAALRRADSKDSRYPNLWIDRGLVRLRLGDYDRALGDFNDGLKAMPKHARALYGRGVVEARKGNKAASDADLAEAEKIAPKLVERFQKAGIVP